jgi:DNA replication factor GINS
VAEETITFEVIRRIQREEQSSPKLVKLPENFYATVSEYLNRKRSMKNKDRKVVLEIKNVERLVEDIFNRRERKIINSAIITARTGIPPENLTDEEKEFYQNLVEIIKRRRDSKLRKILEEKKEEFVSMVIFKEDVPEFLGVDEKKYGPFKKGDIAKLPEENVRVLLQRGLVEEFKVTK